VVRSPEDGKEELPLCWILGVGNPSWRVESGDGREVEEPEGDSLDKEREIAWLGEGAGFEGMEFE